MVREILQISVGQCGNQIGRVFWENILSEHEIDRSNGTFTGDDIRKIEKLDVYMQQTKDSNRYVPRSVLLDLEPGVLDSIKASPIGSLFSPEYMVNAVSGAGNNWAKGHYVAGAEIIDTAMDCVRKCVENSECLQGFQLTQALGGGTGSGFGTLVLNKLRDLYPDRINCTYSVYPAPKVSDIVVEPYNALLSIAHLMETSDETFVIDNQSLMQISDKIMKQKDPSFADLNWVISLIMSGVTASLRFSGLLNGDLRKIATNLVPFPRLHFFSCAFAPLFERGKAKYTNWSFRQITEDIWRDDHFLADVHQIDGKFLSCCINYRGSAKDTSSYVIDQTIKEMQLKNEDRFVRWIPNNVKTSIITIPPAEVDKCATLMSNTTAIKSVFMRISAQFASLFKRRAFLHWYTNEGMDEMEFISADQEMRDLICEYQQKQDAIYTTPSPPSTDSEDFELRNQGKSENEKAQAFIARKLKKLEKQMEREQREREFEEKNRDKSVFGNIRNVQKTAPKYKAKKRPKRETVSYEKKRAAIVWSDDGNDSGLSEESEVDGIDEHETNAEEIDEHDKVYDEDYDNEQAFEEGNYDENDGNYDENDGEEFDENEQGYDANYDENGHYDENGDYDENEVYEEDGVYEENDGDYDGVYEEENYDEIDGDYEAYEEDYEEEEVITDKKKSKKVKVEDDLAFLDSD